MQYIEPSIFSVHSFHISSTLQTGGFESCPDMSFLQTEDCACICPDILLCNETADASDVQVDLVITLVAGDCHATFENIDALDGNNIVDGIIDLGCSANNYTCTVDSGDCDAADKGQTGTVCITALSVNGVPQDGYPICEEGVGTYFVDRAIDACAA